MRRILSVFTLMIMMLCGCSAQKMTVSSEATEQFDIINISEQSSESYTVDDLIVLQDFLLCKRTTGNGKDFDLNNDGVWNVFDLCMMKREVIKNQMKDTSNILVTYFSCTGTTETIAKYASQYLNSDIYEIVPQEPYTDEDLEYYTDCRADREQNDQYARPAISGTVENMQDYDIIFVGYPIWHGQAPKIVYTFLESYDFSDKIIVPFCTSQSSGIGSSAANLHSLAESADWYEGRRFSGTSTQTEVTEWIDSLELKGNENADMEHFYITAGNSTFTAEFAENSSAEAFRELLLKDNLTINMSDYGNFEKVGSLGTTLPRNDENITTEPGDIILYQGNSITVYYDVNTWNFTRLGKIKNTTKEQLLEAFGNGDIEITFSLNKNSESENKSAAEFNLET